MNNEAYIEGYLAKSAASVSDADLPGGSYWHMLAGHLSGNQAGRAAAVQRAQGKEPGTLLKHPLWSELGGFLGGAGLGAAGGAGVGLATGEPGAAVPGALIGGVGGGIAGAIITRAMVLSRVKRATKGFQESGRKVDRKAIKRQLADIAQRDKLWRGARGFFGSSAVGPYDRGEVDQLKVMQGQPHDTLRDWRAAAGGSDVASVLFGLPGALAAKGLSTAGAVTAVDEAKEK
jgi:hypothetical protein